MEYTYIQSDKDFSNYLQYIKDAGVNQIALDIEGESNLHVYGEQLCLVQVFEHKQAVIIDPFRVSEKLLKEFLENRDILKIMFDAQGDRAFLYKNLGIDLVSILDLQPAVELLNFPKRDLSSVLAQALHLDIGSKSEKKRFQRYNWTQRPLSTEALQYAVGDVSYLFALKDRLLYRTVEAGLLDSFILKNLQIQNKPHVYEKLPGMLRSNRFKKLNAESRERIQAYYWIRDEFARKLNLPPNTVIPNDQLFRLAQNQMSIDDIRYGRDVPSDMQKILRKKITLLG